MKTTSKTHTILFTGKGRVVVPQWLRKKLEIKGGTRAHVYRDGDTIVLKPITLRHIRSLRGTLKGSGVLKSLMAGRKCYRESR